jgi:hypothetical protein
MQRALTRAFGAALLLLALFLPRLGHAADARPILRVVPLLGGEAPSWFAGFVKHLERELGLRGIDVAIVRSERDAGTRRNVGGSGSLASADAELVVEAPSPLRPVLSFSVLPRAEGVTPPGNLGGRVRQVNLAGVPADGCALALAVAADELMRSNWPRAVPSDATRSAGDGKARGDEKATAEGKATGEGKRSGVEDGTAAPVPGALGDGRRQVAPQVDHEASTRSEQNATSTEEETRATDVAPSALAIAAGSGARSGLGVAAAGEAFAGGQTQVGPDIRLAVRVVPRLEVEVRGGWRYMLRHQAPNGIIDGNVLVAGGALRVLVLGGERATVWFVGRGDLLRVAYSGEPRDDATTDRAGGNRLGFVVAAGPRARIALTRSLAIEGELLAGASPIATTATDTWKEAVSTNGAALLGSLGLSLGL